MPKDTTSLPLVEDYPPEGRVFEVAGTPFHAVTQGSGPDVVLIHGAGGNARDWTFAMMDQLDDRYRVTAIDRPGLGYTGRIPGTEKVGESLDQQSDLIVDAMKELGIRRAVMVGQSYGGAVALNFALRHPNRTAAVVTVSGVSHPWDTKLDTWYRVNSTWLGQNLLIPVVSKVANRRIADKAIKEIFAPDTAPQGYLDHMGLPLSVRVSQLRANTQQVNRLLSDVEAQYARYPGLTEPVEIIHGTADEIVPFDLHAARLINDLPNARLTKLEDVGHMPHHAREPQVIDAIDRAAKRAGLR